MWFKQASAMNAPINRSILMTKANDLAKKMGEINFNATDGWLTRLTRSNFGQLYSASQLFLQVRYEKANY